MRKLFFTSLILLTALACHPEQGGSPEPVKEAYIKWEAPAKIANGGYARIHRLNDGRYILVYSNSHKAFYRLSEDNCQSWGQPIQVEPFFYEPYTDASGVQQQEKVAQANSECIQLSPDNPYHPGRIIYANNHRPVNQMSSVYPYSIAIKTSDDNLKTWSAQKVVCESEKWPDNVLKGCWEPFLLELPDGTVQIYFADETLTYAQKRTDAYVAMIESKDGGDTWSASLCKDAKRVCYTEGSRDGMPVAMVYEGNIYVTIESNPKPYKLHPQIVYTSLEDNWSTTVLKDSPYRFEPVQNPPDWSHVIGGATYIIQTENYIVQSYQTDNGLKESTGTANKVAVVNFCHKSEVKNGKWPAAMRGDSRPFGNDIDKSKYVWNSLCALDGDGLVIVSEFNSEIIACRGRIISPDTK